MLGTSGWQYRDWRGPFYPTGLRQSDWLSHYARAFATVEINNAFYRLPERDTFARWRTATETDTETETETAEHHPGRAEADRTDDPDAAGGRFWFAVKMSRYLTHIKRLADPAEPVARFLDRARGLGDRLGPVLLQLPPTLRADADLLDAALRRFPHHVRVAVEPRHDSWWDPGHEDAVRAVLEKYDAALVWADRLGRPQGPLWRTSSWGYARLHEGAATPRPRYGRTALETWVRRIAESYGADRDVYVYFNNDPGCAAVADATALGRIARRRGLPVTRFPQA